ncbi:tRNA (adenosine(37)-N6)-threonylcarbamoyltransferase complex ATPase subunit type 1 TsaE [Alkalihalobacterium sp. APHAB7]|uniref:tRNA (adenosine(37)-N6)-threonylcarbamoyltransferase complex ATPase subunit type 1 TsaE n=1 Tax=Alkalihalobacterium sp. APHAB7 TaxID=3402081 RepID=UPI003AABFB65
MEKYTWNSHSPEETFEFGERLAKHLTAGDLLTLEGDLGAGKTSFTKGVGKGLGVQRVINSPTFTIIKEYKGDLPLYHMDVYRLEHSEEDLGFDEYFEGEGVTVVEWASMIKEMLPEERLDIYIYHTGNEERTFELCPKGDRFISLCKELF